MSPAFLNLVNQILSKNLPSLNPPPMAKHLATITLIGHDKAGVIARITQLLFQLGANIEAMEEQVTRGQFSMTLQASWTPARFDRTKIHSTA